MQPASLHGSTDLGTGTLNSAGQAAYSTSSLAVGTHSITAAYAGDASLAASTSSAVTVTVTAAVAGFCLSLSPATGTVAQGSTATSTITITPSGGFNQSNHFCLLGFAGLQYLLVFAGNGYTGRECCGDHDPDPGDKRGNCFDPRTQPTRRPPCGRR